MKLLMRDSLNFEAGRAEGRAEGRTEGRAEGEKQGIVKGTLREKFATAKRMLNLGFKISEIMESTQLSLEDLNSLVHLQA